MSRAKLFILTTCNLTAVHFSWVWFIVVVDCNAVCCISFWTAFYFVILPFTAFFLLEFHSCNCYLLLFLRVMHWWILMYCHVPHSFQWCNSLLNVFFITCRVHLFYFSRHLFRVHLLFICTVINTFSLVLNGHLTRYSSSGIPHQLSVAVDSVKLIQISPVKSPKKVSDTNLNEPIHDIIASECV